MNLRYWGSDPAIDEVHIARLVGLGRDRDVDISVEYVDVVTYVERAIMDNIIVTPTLDRLAPMPRMRLIAMPSDMSDMLAHLMA
jgi:hypothetical protein